jgi:effector-binding domain-containing protein
MSNYSVVECSSRATASVRRRVKLEDLPEFFAESLPMVLEAIEEQGAVPGGEPFARYRGAPNGSVDVEAGFPVAGDFAPSGEIQAGQLPGGRVIAGLLLGAYDSIGQMYAKLTAWAIAHGLRPTQDLWEVYLTDPERESDRSHRRAGVFLRVE